MTAIALLLLVISFSLLITRSAAVMLELTGMSRDSARFQARAAYCGVGYSSRESEGIISHPLRRQIVSTLMLLGNAGTATVIATLILSFRGVDNWFVKLLMLLAGLATLYFIASSSWVDKKMTQFVQTALKRFTRLDLNDYVALLHLSRGYSVLEVQVQPGDWMNESDLASLRLPSEGVIVLGIKRASDGQYIGAPTGAAKLHVGDVLTVYGKLDQLEELNHRRSGRAGSDAHQAAIKAWERDLATDENGVDSAATQEF